MAGCCHHSHDHSHGTNPAVSPDLPASDAVVHGVRTSIRILQMDCPTEEALIRQVLVPLPSVNGMEFNLMQRVLTVAHAPDALDTVLQAVRSLGFQPEVLTAGRPAVLAVEPPKPWWPLALAGAAAVASEAVGWLALPEWLVAALALLAVVSCGLTTYRKGWVALCHGNLNINALMSIAVTW